MYKRIFNYVLDTNDIFRVKLEVVLASSYGSRLDRRKLLNFISKGSLYIRHPKDEIHSKARFSRNE